MDTKRSSCRVCLIEKSVKDQSFIDINNEVLHLANIELKESSHYRMFICVTCASDIRFALRVKNKILESEWFVRGEIEKMSDRERSVIMVDNNSNIIKSASNGNSHVPETEVLQSLSKAIKIENEAEVSNEDKEGNYGKQEKRINSSHLKIVSCISLKEIQSIDLDHLSENVKVEVPEKSVISQTKAPSPKKDSLKESNPETLPALPISRKINAENKQKRRNRIYRKRFCDHCEHTTHNKKDLLYHLYKHFDIKNFSCEYCHHQFRSEANLTHHRNSVHLNLRCEKCKKIMGKCETLDSHQCKIDKYRCRFCQKTFVSTSTLNRHTRNVHLNLKCNECHQHFSSAALKENHDCKIEKIRCSYCQKKFSHSPSLKRHVAVVHHNLNCKKCRKIFSSAVLKQNHDCEIKKYQCNICQNFFSTSSSLRTHSAITHLNLKCRECYQIFSSAALKENHVCKTDKHHCNICQKNFSSSFSLKKHMKNLHHNLRCEICCESFSSTTLKENHDCKVGIDEKNLNLSSLE